MSVFDGLSVPKILFKTQSDINGKIEVLKDGKTTRLKASGVTQSVNVDSPVVPSMVWGRLVDLLMEQAPGAQNILILGLGGGTIQHLISRQLPSAHVTSVDVDPVLVDVAKEYFQVDQIPNHTIIVDDACRVIVTPQDFGLNFQMFDVVVVDIYVGSEYPDLGKSGNFLAHIKKMTVPGGLVIFNRIYLEDHQEDVDFFTDVIEQTFNGVQTMVVAGKTNADNVLIYGRA